MPRATHPGQAALRNRNRVTNKTRLKVIKDSIEADSIVLDEDEEKARVVSTAGVDAEDANEHHLQAVLSAAASRHQAARSTRATEKESAPAAFIPTPDSTGIVSNYEELYPSSRWDNPFTYVKSSDTIEEATSFALANGFIYYMDERDKDWLDKNNEEARGEGTSAQGAVSGTSTRSGRSAKAKGKEPDLAQPVAINEDEFELVMAIFEKVTHEKTEFLHHGLEQGAPFPPFSDYHDTFAAPLQPDIFAVYQVPEWVPHPQHLLRFARVIYPYWRERRLERGGHRIIPIVNLDETDTKNESYICFRRREIKAIRKTRASQASYSDRLVRLQSELGTTLELVRLVHQREVGKREAQSQNQLLWEKRHILTDLKRARPSLASKEDEELFLDKEKPPKKLKVEGNRSLKIRPRENGDQGSPVAHAEPQIRPKEREAAIRNQIELELQQRKEKDKQWEDASDYPYQASPAPHSCRLFKFFDRRPSGSSTSSALDDEEPEQQRAVRLRRGRGGRFLIDRRCDVRLRPASFGDEEAEERLKKVEERFRFDDDDAPAVGPNGSDEQDRKLVDACQPRHLAITMSLFNEQDHRLFATDPSLQVMADGRQQLVWPFQANQPCNVTISRAFSASLQRPLSVAPIPSISTVNAPASLSSSANGTPVSVSARASSLAHLRISSGGGVRGLSTNMPNGTQGSPHSTPPSSASANGFADAQAAVAEAIEQKQKPLSQSSPNGVTAQPDPIATSVTSPTPVPAKPVSSTAAVNVPNLPNGYQIAAVTGYPVVPKAGYIHPNVRHNGLNLQQMQTISALLPDNNVNIALRQPGAFMMPNGAYPMQMTTARPMQWPVAGQRSPHNSGLEGTNGVDSTASQMNSGSPVRVPSANGVRTPQLARSVPMAPNHSMNGAQGRASPGGAHISRLAPHSPSPHMLSPNMAAAQINVHSSPTRAPQPAIPTPSPSLQTRQIVGGSGAAGY